MDQGLLLSLTRDIEAQLNLERQNNKQLLQDFNYNYALLLERDKTIDILEAELTSLTEELQKEKTRAGNAINQLALAEQRCLHYDTVTAEVKSLKAELHKAHMDIANLSQSLADNTSKLKAMEMKESEHVKTTSDNQIVIERYKMQYQTLSEKMEDAMKEAKLSKEEADKARAEMTGLQDSIIKLRRECADLQIEKDSLRVKLDHANTLSSEQNSTTRNELQHKIASLQRELEHKDEDLQRAVAKYKHDMENLHSELRTCKRTAEVDLKHAEDSRKKAERKMDELIRVSTEQKARIDELLGDISVLKDAVLKEKKRTASLRAELEAQQTDVEGSLRKRALDAETRLRVAEDDLSAKVLEATNLNAMVSKLTIALQLADQENSRLRDVNVGLEKIKNAAALHGPKDVSLEKYEAAIKDMKEQMRRAAECSRTLELENNSYKAKLEEINLKLEELQQDYDKMLEKNKRISADKEILTDMQRRLAETEADNVNLKKKISMLMNGESVEPDSIELLRKMQVHMKLAANMIATLKEQNQTLTLKNGVLTERLNKLIALGSTERDPGGIKECQSGQLRQTGSPRRIPSTGFSKPQLFEEDANGRINMDQLSDLPSNITVLESLSEMSMKLQDILRDACKEAEVHLCG